MLEQTGLMRRATVEDIVANRNRAMTLYADAHAALVLAEKSLSQASAASRDATGGAEVRQDEGRFDNKKGEMEGGALWIKVPPVEAFMATARIALDTGVWEHIIEITDLQRVMDKQAKDALRQSLLTDPPEITVENVTATLEQFLLDADTIFRRGIANVFSALNRRFKSHDGWKVGSRVILSNAFSDYGGWNYHRGHQDSLRDIERTFHVLDGKETPSYGGIIDLIDRERRGFKPQVSLVESEYFRVRTFLNGNAHVWFTRDDLLEKMNKLLGEYYGAPIPEEKEAAEDPLANPKTAIAKNYAFFPTPSAAVDLVLDKVPFYREGDQSLRLLEPSAGTGALSEPMVHNGAIVDVVDVHPERAAALRAMGLYAKVMATDFLLVKPDEKYDGVVMNPPFDRERDIDHVMHALKFLKPDGFLVAVMSAGTEFRETKKAKAFRALMEKMKARWTDLPPGSFSSVGTNINTVILKVWNDGRHFYG